MGKVIEVEFEKPRLSRELVPSIGKSIEVVTVQVANLEGVRVLVELPEEAWGSIQRIARAGNQSPEERLWGIARATVKRSAHQSAMLESNRITRSRAST